MSSKDRVNATVPISLLKEIRGFLDDHFRGRYSGMPVIAVGFYAAGVCDGVRDVYQRSADSRRKAMDLENSVDEYLSKALGTWNKVPE